MEAKTLPTDIETNLPKEIYQQIQKETLQHYQTGELKIKERSILWSISSIAVGIGLSLLISYSFIKSALEDGLQGPVNYKVRQLMGAEPKLSDKLKIFLYDDSSVANLSSFEMNLNQWFEVLKRLDREKPSRIMIDKIFGVVREDEAAQKAFVEGVNSLTTPIFVGSFSASTQIIGRSQISTREASLQKGFYSLEKVLPSQAPIQDLSSQIIYGPSQIIREAFHIGYIGYNGQKHFYPAFQHRGNAFFHLGVDPKLVINKKNEGIWPERPQVNYLRPDVLYGATKPFYALLDKTYSKFISDYVKEGDHILILPAGYTGNADFKDSPVGRIYGGFYIASILNTVLTKQFIEEPISGLLLSCLFVGMCLGLFFTPQLYGWIALVALNGLIIFAGLLLFSFLSIDIAWIQTSITCLFTGSLLLAGKSKTERAKSSLLKKMHAEYKSSLSELIISRASERVLIYEKQDAAMMAQAFTPDPSPKDWSGIDITTFHKCFDAASGDWFFFERANNKKLFHIVLCDITGHGIRSALVVSSCKATLTMLKKYSPETLDSPDFAAIYAKELNSVLYEQSRGKHCTTMAALTIDLDTRSLSYMTCGHPPILLPGKDGEPIAKYLSTRGITLIGLEPDTNFFTSKSKIDDHASFLLYSDGVPIFEHFIYFKRFHKKNKIWLERPKDLYDFYCSAAKKRWTPNDDVSMIVCRLKDIVS